MAWDTRDIFCEGCGYNLREQRNGDCPECGAVFDRGEASTYRYFPISKTERFFDRHTFLLCGIGFVLIVIYECWGIYRAGDNSDVWQVIMYFILAFGSFITHFTRTPKFKG